MFKKFISSLGIMLIVLSINAAVQDFETHRLGVCKFMPNYSAQQVTSKIDVKDGEFWEGYWNGANDDRISMVGAQRTPEEYDAAICYPAGSAIVTGLTIEGIKFAFPSTKNVKNVMIWMSTTLPKNAKEADIMVQRIKDITDLNNENNPFVEVRFGKPYKYDPDKDLYIGYSFTVSGGDANEDKFPVVIYTGEDKPNSFWLKIDGNEGFWDNYYGAQYGVLAIQTLMSGRHPENAVTMQAILGTISAAKNSEITIPLTVENAGTEGIQSIDLSIDVNGVKTSTTIKPESQVSKICEKYEFNVNVTAPEETGMYDIKVNVDKVNCVENPINAVAKGSLIVVTRVVKKTPVVEEFMAMWCGYCPRAIIAFQKLREIFQDDVALVSIHIDDALNCSKDYLQMLGTVPGFPRAHYDRTYWSVDPYFGLSEHFGGDELVNQCAKTIPLAQVDVKAYLDGDILTAKSEIEFLYTGDGSKYGVSYVLTEDGMCDDSWQQTNYYSGVTDQGLIEMDSIYEPWINGESEVSGVVYNDVAIAAKGAAKGIDGALPMDIIEGKKYKHSEEFDLSSYEVIQDKTKLKLIVILLDNETGKVVNASCVPLYEDTGIVDVDADNEAYEEIARYTVDGNRIIIPHRGINIIKYSNGSVKKVIVK